MTTIVIASAIDIDIAIAIAIASVVGIWAGTMAGDYIDTPISVVTV